MITYLCPSDKKYACSWEGQAEDILPHFEQEHDDILHYSDSFEIDLEIPSENRLLLICEEIYLAQIRISKNNLKIFLRYLGPLGIASRISYNVLLKVNSTLCNPRYIVIEEEGCVNIDLSKLEAGFQRLQCTLNIIQLSDENSSNDEVFIPDSSSAVNGSLPHMPLKIKVDRKVSEQVYWKHTVSSTEVSLSRSKTITIEDLKRRNIKRCLSTISLGAINETADSKFACTNCGESLSPPVYLCSCDHNFCSKCQPGVCKLCTHPVTSSRNMELEARLTRYLLPCRYKKYGCPQKVIFNELANHESSCIFCSYKCPVEGCGFEGQFKNICKHLKVIHGSVKMLESFIVVFQTIPEAFLVDEEKGVFYCCVKYFEDSVLWQAKFCGPKERKFFCELKFKEGKLKQPLLLMLKDNVYSIQMSLQELKKRKLKAKHAILTVTC